MEKSVIEVLTKKFDSGSIKKRQGSFGKQLSYLETHSVIDRLNAAFDQDWSFEILDPPTMVRDNQIVVRGRLSVLQDGKPPIVKEAFGGKQVFAKGALGDDFKSASSDCLKKCASLLGVGLELYQDPVEESDDSPKAVTKTEAEENTSALPEQITAITKMIKAKKLDEKTVLEENKVLSFSSLSQSAAKVLINKLNEYKAKP